MTIEKSKIVILVEIARKDKKFYKRCWSQLGVYLSLFIVRKDYPERQYRNVYVYSPPHRDNLPCDLYFSDLEGDWDFNRNNTFGEVGD